MKSKFNQDYKSEQLLSKWLDEYFYKRLLKDGYSIKSKFKNQSPIAYVRDGSREAQKKGIDVHYHFDSGESLLVDEKAQLNYLNNPLETFAFEIIYKKQNNKNTFTQGWFINDELETTHYLLVYPHSDHVDKHYQIKCYQQFSKAEVVLVEKIKLKEKLESLSINKARIYEKSMEIIDTDIRKTIFENIGDRDVYMVKTDYLAEKPINIVVRKHILNEIAEARWLVTRENIKEI